MQQLVAIWRDGARRERGDSASGSPDAGPPIEAGDDGSKGLDAAAGLDAGLDGSHPADAGDGADAGTFPTGTGGTVVPGTYQLSVINLYGDTGTAAASDTVMMTLVLEQGDGGQTFVGQIIHDQTGGGFTANMDVTFASDQYEATYTCVDPLNSQFGTLSVTPPGAVRRVTHDDSHRAWCAVNRAA